MLQKCYKVVAYRFFSQICVFRGRSEDLVGFVHISMSGIMKASTDVTMNVSTYAGCYPVRPLPHSDVFSI